MTKSSQEKIRKEIKFLRQKIDRLNFLSKGLQISKDFKQFEKLWFEYRKLHEFSFPFWRGADTQVVLSHSGENEEDWRKLKTLSHGYHLDDPCPSRYPEMLSGLLLKLGEEISPIRHNQRHEFYFNIHRTCIRLEEQTTEPSRVQTCSHIIFEQIRLLNTWVQELIVDLETPPPPNLIELGWRYYFAYGRNVNRTAMLSSERCPEALGGVQANLLNHRFAMDERQVATVIPEKGKNVIGLLWLINPADEARLDLREGVNTIPPCYRKKNITVKVANAEMFGVTEEVEALVYISNFSEGSSPREGYVEEIIEGLVEALYSESELHIYHDLLTDVSTIYHKKLADTPPALPLTKNDCLLTREFFQLIKEEAERSFTRLGSTNKKDSCKGLFACLNHCFRINSKSDGDPKRLAEFLIKFIPPKKFELLFKCASLRKLSELKPLITSDNILLDNGIRPDSTDLHKNEELTLKAQAAHKQFISEYSKTLKNFTPEKMKRLIRKLSSLLWTIRSNMVHGSKLGLNEQYERRGNEITQITYDILFDLFNALLAGSLTNFATYGELRRDETLHSEYMRNFEFIGDGIINGSEWHDVDNQRWVEIDVADDNIVAELYKVNTLADFNTIDQLEALAHRKLTKFTTDRQSSLAWVYSKKEDYKLQHSSSAGIQNVTTDKSFKKTDALAIMYSSHQLKKKFELQTSDKYKVTGEIKFTIDEFGFESTNENTAILVYSESGDLCGLKFKHAAELNKHYELFKYLCDYQIMPKRNVWQKIEKGLFSYFHDEVLYLTDIWPDTIVDAKGITAEKLCQALVAWFYEAVFSRVNQISENYEYKIAKSMGINLDEFGKNADDLFSDLLEFKEIKPPTPKSTDPRL